MKPFLWCLVILGVLVHFEVLGQKSPDSVPRDTSERMKRYEEMHRQLRERLMRGAFDQSFDDIDQMFNGLMSDSIGGLGQMKIQASSYQSEWKETKEGRILVVAPAHEEAPLDIDVQNGMINIKGKVVEKIEREGKNGKEQVVSSSHFNSSVPVPEDTDANKVKIESKNGKITLFFPFKVNPDRKPLPKNSGDIDI